MEAIILAGGMGTRLRETVADLPKPMAPVNGKPFLFYLLTWLKEYSVEKIIISTGYRSDSIKDYFGESFSGMPLEYAVEVKPLGTGGAIKYAMHKTLGNEVLIMNGDTWFPLNIDSFLLFHIRKSSCFSVALRKMQDFSRYGNVECRDDTIIRFTEKKFCKEGLINGGIYIINREFLHALQLPEVFSLESDLLEKLAGSSVLKCMVFDEPFLDIGTPDDYKKAGSFLPGK